MNVTYADVVVFGQQPGSVASAETVLFNYGSYPRATTVVFDNPANRSSLQIGPSYVQGGNITTTYTFKYVNATKTLRVITNDTVPAQPLEAASPPPGRRLSQADPSSPCNFISEGLFTACQQVASEADRSPFLSALDGSLNITPGQVADIGGELIERFKLEVGEVTSDVLEQVVDAQDQLDKLLTGFQTACSHSTGGPCQAANPGCSPLCQNAPVQKTVYSENRCLDVCMAQYPLACCQTDDPGFYDSFCEATGNVLCSIECGVCGFNGYP